MSTAGIYNAHQSIMHGTEPYLHNQMKSQQVPHYFGGSQIPINLHHHMIKGNGMPHFENMEALEADRLQRAEKYSQELARDKIARDKMAADSLARGTIGKQKMDATIAGWRKVNPWTNRPAPTAPTTPAPQIAGNGIMGGKFGYSYEAGRKVWNEDKRRAAQDSRDASNRLKQEQEIAAMNNQPPPNPAYAYTGTGFFGDFMGGFSQGLDMMLGGRINDPQTYRKHTIGLSKSIGSNTYRTSKV